MASQKEIKKRELRLLEVVTQSGITKKSKLIEHIRNNKALAKEFAGVSDVQLYRNIKFPTGDDIIDEGHFVKGRSIHKNGKGETISEWVKTDTDRQLMFQRMTAAVDAMKGKMKPYKPVNLLDIDRSPMLCNMYTITDYHLGMFSWVAESGSEWNTKLAEKMLIKWFEKAIQKAPNAKQAIFAQLGDFLHFDGLEAITPTSKHVLDADTRYQELVRIFIRVSRRIIEMLLCKYEHVHILHVEGNHDLASTAWMKETTADMYRNEPRVSVDTNPLPYHNYMWGDNCLFFAHSHTKKLGALDSVFVRSFRENYGKSKFAYAFTGHLHHEKMLETNLMKLYQFATLSAKDAYAARGGFMSDREAKVITFHKRYGKVGEHVLTPEMIM